MGQKQPDSSKIRTLSASKRSVYTPTSRSLVALPLYSGGTIHNSFPHLVRS